MQANQANVTFDTHKAVKALKSSGFDEKQAEAVVETIDEAVNETVATKSDLALLGAELGGVKKTVGDIQDDIDKNMATKSDLALLAAKMATKEELGILANKMATKDALKDLATKADLEVMAAKIETLEKTVEGIQKNIDENMATKAEIANLESRIMRMMLIQTLVLVGMLIPVIIKLLL